ncbi:PAS domain-containing protein [Chryseosolibacter indicus]|uniref:PAS domain-containing protein n=1 Tax=Chryseosolibacter indicus TaxID=2782351 RepID=A0ABS5VKD3_9BACT|nr:PAS domain-containing protein [Chryseosolibacter indicus]MBT1701897.1 PAS domain-containing protein [Chryseosolibacter indicus]
MKLLNLTLVQKDRLKKLYENVNHQNHQIKNAADFIKEIESGNLEAKFNIDSNEAGTDNLLAASLESMRNRLKKISMDEEERNWVREGLAQFVEILRAKNNNTNELADSIISNLVKYMNANQGALYIVNDDTADIFIERVACYAYSRKKFQDQKIALGEGSIGQVVLEKETIYMTNIPSNFIKITSGLGEALPKHLLIVPLKLEDNVLGVVELASFANILPYQIRFIERLGESIASSLSTVKTTQRTNALLKESQYHAEQLRSQEEEMRQNMEELSATQEEMQRILKEVEGKEAYVKHLLDVSTDSIYTVDKSYRLVSWNKTFARSLEQFGMRLEKGSSTLDWYKGDERTKQLELYERALKGENINFTAESEINGSKYYFHSIYASLTNHQGEIYEVAVFSRNVTDAVEAGQQTERLLNESQQKAEELKAQEEELRQNMEELSATQDEMQRVLTEVQNREAFMTDLMNATNDSIITIDKDYKIISCNKATVEMYSKFGMEVGKGFNIFDLFTQEQREVYKAYYDRSLKKGETFEVTERYSFKDREQYFAVTYSPLRDEQGAIIGAAIFGKDISETVAAKNNAEKLLNDSQHQTEELKAQEEELRQNMEELSATQDEIQRVLTEVQNRESFMTDLMNATNDSIITIDREYKVISCNKTTYDTYAKFGMEVGKGFNIFDLFTEEQRPTYRAYYDRGLNGETFEVTERYSFKDREQHFAVTYSPLRDKNGAITGVAIFGKDVSEAVSARTRVEKLLNESQQQSEELKAQEEELRQNMEELSATQEEMQRVLEVVQKSEQYIKGLLDESTDSILTIDKNYCLLHFNKTFSSSFESRGTAVNKGFDILNIFPPEVRDDKRLFYKRIFNGETIEITEKLTTSGFNNTFIVRHAPLKDAEGNVEAIAIIARDISVETQSKEEVNNLSVNREFMQEIFNGCKIAIHVVDKEFRLLDFNQPFQQRIKTNTGVELVKGMVLPDIIENEKERAQMYKHLKRVFKGESFEQLLQFTRGEVVHYFSEKYSPIHDNLGKIVAAGIYAEDVTELISAKKLYEKLQAERN